MALVTVENLSFKYSGGNEDVLSDINLKINDGEYAVICGESGCGKTTLMRLLKKQLSPKGDRRGGVYYRGVDISDLDQRTAVADIGYVMQNPDNQIVTDKVWHELAFGLENLGVSQDEIERRVAELASYFGINSWYNSDTDTLSGGQKQILNLASVMATNPKVLLLDEPTAQLDVIAANEFLSLVRRINLESGITVIMIEHRLEEVVPVADRVIYMKNGRIMADGEPRRVCAEIAAADTNGTLTLGLPTSVRLYGKLGTEGVLPLTTAEGQRLIERYDDRYDRYDVLPYTDADTLAIECDGVYYRYSRKGNDVLHNCDMKVRAGEIYCLLGGNGAGKSTLLRVLSGLGRHYSGKVKIFGKRLADYKASELYRGNIASLPQNPETLFVKNNVYDDLRELCKILDFSEQESREKIDETAELLGIKNLYGAHPFDLSGGEMQKAAFAKVLLVNPRIILADEPTKGLDAGSKKVFGNILRKLKAEGKTILIVSHDIEFCAEYADRCAMMFDGKIISETNPISFFADNNYYTTAACRISRNKYYGAITVDMLAELCIKNGVKNG